MANKLKLSIDERDQIRQEYASGDYTQDQLARKWKVAVATIKTIIHRTAVVDMNDE